MKPLVAKKRVIVIGGSFAGLCSLRHLKQYDFDITLIEPKGYFEYTPGILHLLSGSKGDLVSPITPLALDAGAAKVIQGKFIGFDKAENSLTVEVFELNGVTTTEILKFDAAIICSGVPYTAPIRASIQSPYPTFKDRLNEIENYLTKLSSAKHIVVSGGGLVGVELAAELSVRLEKSLQSVTLITRSDLLASLPPSAGKYALEWLKKRKNVNLLLSDEIANEEEINVDSPGVLTTNSNKSIPADVYIDCTGRRTVSSRSPTVLGQLLTPFNKKGLIPVDQFLRVMDGYCPSGAVVFAAGDVVEHNPGMVYLCVCMCAYVYVSGGRISLSGESGDEE